MSSPSEYEYRSAEPTHDDLFLWKVLQQELLLRCPAPTRLFEIGCGNGFNARRMAALKGFTVLATDSSASAIKVARTVDSPVQFEQASVYDPLAEKFGTFDAVVALEVIEHLYSPQALAQTTFNLLKPGGVAFFSTPYHGWLKNMLIVASGKFDAHFNPLWEHGHIKFFTPNTLSKIMTEKGFRVVTLKRLGRIPAIARSMLLVVQRPK